MFTALINAKWEVIKVKLYPHSCTFISQVLPLNTVHEDTETCVVCVCVCDCVLDGVSLLS